MGCWRDSVSRFSFIFREIDTCWQPVAGWSDIWPFWQAGNWKWRLCENEGVTSFYGFFRNPAWQILPLSVGTYQHKTVPYSTVNSKPCCCPMFTLPARELSFQFWLKLKKAHFFTPDVKKLFFFFFISFFFPYVSAEICYSLSTCQYSWKC